MPRRKRTSGDGGRRPTKVCRVEHSEETLIISDSEHEEEEECSASRSSRAARWRRRECKSHLQEMTEDEMLDLAMKLSAQEANSAAQRRELEDSDIQKAIAESLNDGNVEASSSLAQPQQSVSDVISRLRRKLSYPNQKKIEHSKRESPAAQADGIERGSTSPLPEMPNLSQTSSNSLTQVCEPPVASQDTTPDTKPIIKDKNEFSQFVSPSQRSLTFPKHGSFTRQPVVCVEKLSQDIINASAGSREQPFTQESIVGPSCAETSHPQEDSSLSKSHVFTQNDFRGSTDPCASEENESVTQIPDEDLPAYKGHKGLSPENTDLEECSSPSRRSELSRIRCEPENANEDATVTSNTPDLKQVKDQISQDENTGADAESESNTHSWDRFSSYMVVLLTDDEDGSEEVLPPSPVLNDRSALKRVPQTQPCTSSSNPQHALQDNAKTSKDLKSKSSNPKPVGSGVDREECTVSYYWGVPFCPTGQNPDEYTRVIMCQLEVYEKSLKEARRELLRKAEWSQPVLPTSERPCGLRRLKRYRPPQLSEDEEQNDEESEKKNKRTDVEEEREDKEESVAGSEEAADGGQSETYVVLSSPEAKDEDVQKSPFPNQDKTAGTTPLRNDQWDASDNTQIECADEEEETQNHDQFDDDTVCPETQLTDDTPELMVTGPASPQKAQSRAESEMMEVDEQGGALAAEDERMEQESVSADTAPPETQKMECPICSRLFSLSTIEVHAASCNVETEDQNQEEPSQVVRRTRFRRDTGEETPHRSEKSPQMEKCFVCQGMFTSQQYPAHVQLCLKRTDTNINQGDDLLSALERTEQRPAGSDEAGPSDVSSKSNRGPADLSAGDWPITEDSDFQQQESSKNSQRLARKRKYKR